MVTVAQLRAVAGGSDLENTLLWQIRMAKLAMPEREHRFHPTRKWRFDLAWPELKLAVEVDGGTWVQGRHNRGSSIEKEYEKGAEAAILGWRVIHVSNHMVDDGRALNLIQRALTAAEAASQ